MAVPGSYKRLIDALPVFEQALCRTRPDLDWVPTATWHESGPAARRAIRVCCQCPHVAPCAAYAIANPFLVGIWGGLTTAQRHALAGRPAEQVQATRDASLPVPDRECAVCGRTYATPDLVARHQRRRHPDFQAPA